MDSFAAGSGKQSFTIGSIFSKGWEAFSSLLGQIVTMTALLYTPLFALSVMSGVGNVLSQPPAPNELPNFSQVFPVLIFSILGMLFYLLEIMAIARMVEIRASGGKPSFVEALKHAVTRMPAGIITAFLATLIVLGMTLLLIVPGIMWSVYYTFIFFVVSLRGKAGMAALGYSKSLVKGSWWKIFFTLVVIALTVAVVSVLSNLAFGFTLQVLPKSPWFNFITFFLQQIFNAFSYVSYAVLFLNLESAKGLNSSRV